MHLLKTKNNERSLKYGRIQLPTETGVQSVVLPRSVVSQRVTASMLPRFPSGNVALRQRLPPPAAWRPPPDRSLSISSSGTSRPRFGLAARTTAYCWSLTQRRWYCPDFCGSFTVRSRSLNNHCCACTHYCSADDLSLSTADRSPSTADPALTSADRLMTRFLPSGVLRGH